MKTKRVREDESGDSEDSEDDKLPEVIGGESEGVCIAGDSRRSVGVCSIDKVQHTEKSN